MAHHPERDLGARVVQAAADPQAGLVIDRDQVSGLCVRGHFPEQPGNIAGWNVKYLSWAQGRGHCVRSGAAGSGMEQRIFESNRPPGDTNF